MLKAVNEYEFRNSNSDETQHVIVNEELGSSDKENEIIAFDLLGEKLNEPISRSNPCGWYLDDVYPFGDEVLNNQ